MSRHTQNVETHTHLQQATHYTQAEFINSVSLRFKIHNSYGNSVTAVTVKGISFQAPLFLGVVPGPVYRSASRQEQLRPRNKGA